MNVLIIGGVAGGASAAARLRRLDESAEIVVLERGGYISFANCGLPYHVGDVIHERDDLLLMTPEKMKARFDIDVRVRNVAVAIDTEKRVVTVRAEGGEYEESYDELLIATGSSPVIPHVPGIDDENIHVLWNIDDVDRIKGIIDMEKPESAVVVGGGFIGLEMAENLAHRGVSVTIAEALDQVMAPFDPEMAEILHKNIRDNGVALRLGDGVEAFEKEDGRTVVVLSSGDRIKADMVILSIGVRPNSALAEAAGIKTNERGGIITDDMMRTSAPHVWAVGDAVEVEDLITREKTMVPLAGPANKQGRLAAANMLGGEERYRGTMGTSVAKVFDLTAASTGLNEKKLTAGGAVRGRDYEKVIIAQKSHAGYYPGAENMIIKLLFDMRGKVLGAQIAGREGVDKRIDTIAVTISFGGSIYDLKDLELAYAPPYSSAKDPVNMAGFTAENLLNDMVRFVSKDELDGKLLLDVREENEVSEFAFPDAMVLPFSRLRKEIDSIPKDRPVVVTCAVGVRAYNVSRILTQHGFEDVSVLAGGAAFYRMTV